MLENMSLRNIIIIIFGLVIMFHVTANCAIQEGNVSQGTSNIINLRDHPNLYVIVSKIIDKLLPNSMRNPQADGKFASTCINVLSDEKYAEKHIKKLDIFDLIRNIKEIKPQLSDEIEKDLRNFYNHSNYRDNNGMKVLFAVLLYLGDFELDKSQMNIGQIKELKKFKENDEFQIYLWNIQLAYDNKNFRKFNEFYMDVIANEKWVSINSKNPQHNTQFENFCKMFRSDLDRLINLAEKLNGITPEDLRMAVEKTLDLGVQSKTSGASSRSSMPSATKEDGSVESVIIPQHKREIATHQFISTIEDAIHEYKDEMRSV